MPKMQNMSEIPGSNVQIKLDKLLIKIGLPCCIKSIVSIPITLVSWKVIVLKVLVCIRQICRVYS